MRVKLWEITHTSDDSNTVKKVTKVTADDFGQMVDWLNHRQWCTTISKIEQVEEIEDLRK